MVPATDEQLAAIPGIGPATMEQFGFDILDVVSATELAARIESPPGDAEPATDHGSTADADAASLETDADSDDHTVTDAYWTWRLFRDGYTADQVAAIRRLPIARLVDDLAWALASGHEIDASWINSPEAAERLSANKPATGVGG